MSLNKQHEQEIIIDEGNSDVVHLVTFDRGFSPSGANRVQIEMESGEAGNLMYQVATRYYVPWDAVAPTPELEPLVRIDVAYDRTI